MTAAAAILDAASMAKSDGAQESVATNILRLLLKKQGIQAGTAVALPKPDWVIGKVRVGENVTVVDAKGAGISYLFKLSTVGRHFAQSAVEALSCVADYGADPLTAAMDIAMWQPQAGQGARAIIVTDMAKDGESLTLIDCSEVGSRDSLAVSFEILANARPTKDVGRIVKGRRIAIVGDVTGFDGVAIEPADLQALDQVHCIGHGENTLWARLTDSQRGLSFDNPAALAGRITRVIDAGDVVMVLGAKQTNLGVIVDAIKKLGHRRSQEQ